MGKEGTGTSNENGEHLIEMYQANGLSIGGTWFPHKKCQIITWIYPNGLTEDQIDHFLVSKRWRSSLQDVRARRSVDIGSDHHLVVGVMKLKLARAPRRKSRREKFDVKKLQNPEKRLRFQLELKNRFAALPIKEVSLEQEWETIKSEHLETCKEVFGKMQRHRKQWITEETWRTIEERRTAKEEVSKAKTRLQKQRAIAHYNEKVIDVKLKCRSDKKKYIEGLADEAEDAVKRNCIKKLYDTTRKLSGKKNDPIKPVQSKEGNILCTQEEQLSR